MKFRIWDKLEKKMIYPDSLGVHHFIINLKGEAYNLHSGCGASNYPVMQLLQTHPKFGDIYEGDIIRVENLNEWWDIEPLPEEDRYHHLVITDIQRDYSYSIRNAVEKVGNIFENPEIVLSIDKKRLELLYGSEPGAYRT